MIDEKKLIDKLVFYQAELAGKGLEKESDTVGVILRAIAAQTKIEVGKWIPCSEKLPEITKLGRYSEDVITVLQWNDGDITYSVGWYNKYGAWNEDCKNCKVIAWLPLPEPYMP